jgi:hypothetical protein
MLTYSGAKEPCVRVYLIDTVSGAIIHSVVHRDAKVLILLALLVQTLLVQMLIPEELQMLIPEELRARGPCGWCRRRIRCTPCDVC